MRSLTMSLLLILGAALPAVADGGEPPPELLLKQVPQLDDAQVEAIHRVGV